MKMAPPSTPAQPRFLLAKSQKPKSATPLQSGSNQFASTPRFNVSKTAARQGTSSHQIPCFSTPAPPTVRTRAATQFESLSDSIDTSPISTDLPRSATRHRLSLSESIENDSQSPLSTNVPEDAHEVERPIKKRRVTISPDVEATSEDEDEDEDEENYDPMGLDDDLTKFDGSQLSQDQQGPSSTLESRQDSEDPPSPTEPSTRHPTFLSAPRFKTHETVETAGTDRPPLPEAFSPQRRGAKFVTGGLAAEVRDWLVQVKGASEYDRPTGETVRFIIDQSRRSTSGEMCLISGDQVQSGDEIGRTQGHIGAGEGHHARVILAGEGRISELRSKAIVAQGVTVSLYQPIWDINLKDLGRFIVACDWEGEGQES